MIEPSGRDVAAIIREGTAIDRAIEAARRRVVRRHQQLGIPLVIWDGARVVEVAPETVEVPEEQPDDGQQIQPQ
jgi:hypothetical protein